MLLESIICNSHVNVNRKKVTDKIVSAFRKLTAPQFTANITIDNAVIKGLVSGLLNSSDENQHLTITNAGRGYNINVFTLLLMLIALRLKSTFSWKSKITTEKPFRFFLIFSNICVWKVMLDYYAFICLPFNC